MQDGQNTYINDYYVQKLLDGTLRYEEHTYINDLTDAIQTVACSRYNPLLMFNYIHNLCIFIRTIAQDNFYIRSDKYGRLTERVLYDQFFLELQEKREERGTVRWLKVKTISKNIVSLHNPHSHIRSTRELIAYSIYTQQRMENISNELPLMAGTHTYSATVLTVKL